MRIVRFWVALIGIGTLLSACAQTDFAVKISPPDIPTNTAGSASQPGATNVSVVGAEKMNFVLNPLTTVCFPVNFKVTYADAVTKSIKETISRVAVGTAGNPRHFTIAIADFNARVLSLMVDPFVFRHDAEVRVTLHSREEISGGQPIEKMGQASLYYESARDNSGFCDKGQDALAHALQKTMSDALSDLAGAIQTGGVSVRPDGTKESIPGS